MKLPLMVGGGEAGLAAAGAPNLLGAMMLEGVEA